MIPKIIHYFHDYDHKIWKKTTAPQFRMCYMSWLRYCPDYQIMHWHDKMPEFQEMLNQSEFLKFAYKERIWAFVSDYVRLYALQKYGGIYLDTDVQLIKPIDSFLENNCFVSIENTIHNDKNVIEPAIIGAKPNNRIIKKIKEYYDSEEIAEQDEFMAPIIYSYVIEKETGFKKIQFEKHFDEIYQKETKFYSLDNIEAYKKEIISQPTDDITIYPSEYFSPAWEIFKEKSITENTVAIHWNQSSWWGSKEKSNKLRNFENALKKKNKIKILGIKFTFDNVKTNYKFLYDNKKIKLFKHKYNCGVKGVLTERSVEIAIAKNWLSKNDCDFEFGAVTPYYFDSKIKHIIDPADSHPRSKKGSLFDFNLQDKNVLSLSTIEHIGTGDYGVNETNVNAVEALQKILNESKHCLISYPIGQNAILDRYTETHLEELKRKSKITIYKRKGYSNKWIKAKNVNNKESKYSKYTNVLVIIEK